MQNDTYTAEPAIPRSLQLALCVTALLWAGAAGAIAQSAARGISTRFQIGAFESLLVAVFLLFLAVVGLRMLDFIATHGRFVSEVAPLPRRSTAPKEFGVGAALGWALALAAVLPLLLSGNLHGRIFWRSGSLVAILLALAALLIVSLAEEILFRGYIFRRLSAAIGPSWAAILISILFAAWLVSAHTPPNLLIALLDGTLFGLLLALAWLRTHALWLGWGLHFAYRAATAVLLGLPIAGHSEFGSFVDTFRTGPRWLTGGAFGLDAALLTIVFFLIAIPILYRVTRDYAWKYTHAPIVAGGYEVTIAPPAAHAAMEAAAPPPLVQILTPAPPPPIPRDPNLN